MTAQADRPNVEAAIPNPDSVEWRALMGEALERGNLGQMADLLLAGIAKPKPVEQTPKEPRA